MTRYNRVACSILITLILAALPARAAVVVREDPEKPAGLTIYWTNDNRAELRWTQQSDADFVCVDKTTNEGAYVFLGCVDGAPGPHVFALPPSPDGNTRPQPGERIFLAEWKRVAGGLYGRYEVAVPERQFVLWLPIASGEA